MSFQHLSVTVDKREKGRGSISDEIGPLKKVAFLYAKRAGEVSKSDFQSNQSFGGLSNCAQSSWKSE